MVFFPRQFRWQATLWAGLFCCTWMGCSAPVSEDFSPGVVPVAPFEIEGEVEVEEQWWRAFDDSELNSLVERALRDNLDIAQAWDRLAQAEAIEASVRSELFPSVDATGEGQKQWIDGEDGGEFFSAGAFASYELDLWGRVRHGVVATAYDRGAAEADVQTAMISLSAEIASTYFQLREQRGQHRLIGEQLRANEISLEILRTRFRNGKVPASDVLQQEQLVEGSRGRLHTIDATLVILENKLAVLSGRAPRTLELSSAAHLPALPPIPRTGLPAQLIETRPDLRKERARVLAASRREAVAVAERFPQIRLGGSATTSSEKIANLLDDWVATLFASLVAPLIDGGARRAEVERNRAVVSESVHRYRNAILNALREVTDALAQEREQQRLLESIQRQVDLSQRALTQIRTRYRQGGANYIEVLFAQISFQELQRSQLSAQRSLIEFRIALYRALSRGWEGERPSLSRPENQPDIAQTDE